jgi:hypothetical protein
MLAMPAAAPRIAPEIDPRRENSLASLAWGAPGEGEAFAAAVVENRGHGGAGER